MKNLLTTKQAAAFLGVSTKSIKRWRKSGKLIPTETRDNHYCLYSLDQLGTFKNELGTQLGTTWLKLGTLILMSPLQLGTFHWKMKLCPHFTLKLGTQKLGTQLLKLGTMSLLGKIPPLKKMKMSLVRFIMSPLRKICPMKIATFFLSTWKIYRLNFFRNRVSLHSSPMTNLNRPLAGTCLLIKNLQAHYTAF